MRRNPIQKGIVILSLLMVLTVFMASCGENDEIQPQDTTSAVSETDAQTTEHTPEFSVDENGKVLFHPELCCGCDTCIKTCRFDASPRIRYMNAQEVYQEICRQVPFIRGITVSGGECTLYPEFLQ